MASIEQAEILLRLPSLVEVDTSTVQVQTADLPVIDIDSVLLKAAVRLLYFNKRRETYKHAILDHRDHAVICQIIKQSLLGDENSQNQYLAELQRENSARLPSLYNEEGRNILGQKAPIFTGVETIPFYERFLFLVRYESEAATISN